MQRVSYTKKKACDDCAATARAQNIVRAQWLGFCHGGHEGYVHVDGVKTLMKNSVPFIPTAQDPPPGASGSLSSTSGADGQAPAAATSVGPARPTIASLNISAAEGVSAPTGSASPNGRPIAEVAPPVIATTSTTSRFPARPAISVGPLAPPVAPEAAASSPSSSSTAPTASSVSLPSPAARSRPEVPAPPVAGASSPAEPRKDPTCPSACAPAPLGRTARRSASPSADAFRSDTGAEVTPDDVFSPEPEDEGEDLEEKMQELDQSDEDEDEDEALDGQGGPVVPKKRKYKGGDKRREERQYDENGKRITLHTKNIDKIKATVYPDPSKTSTEGWEKIEEGIAMIGNQTVDRGDCIAIYISRHQLGHIHVDAFKSGRISLAQMIKSYPSAIKVAQTPREGTIGERTYIVKKYVDAMRGEVESQKVREIRAAAAEAARKAQETSNVQSQEIARLQAELERLRNGGGSSAAGGGV